MTKSELIERLADQARHIPAKELELAIKELLEQMAQTLVIASQTHEQFVPAKLQTARSN